jgi:hypothetical protein
MNSTTPNQPLQNSHAAPAGWFRGLGAALKFALPLGRQRTGEDPASAAATAHWIVPIGLVIGLLWVGVFRATWRVYGEIATVRVVPALMIVLMESLFTGYYLVMGLARTVHTLASDRPLRSAGLPPDNADEDAGTPPALAGAECPQVLSATATLVLGLAVLVQWVLIVSIPWESPWWPSPTDWRHSFRFLYPAPLYRPLLLTPVWGRWGLLLAATIGRTARHADGQTQALERAMSPGRLLRQTILPLVLTAVYCSRGGNLVIGAIISLLVFGATYAAAVIMARRGGGQTRQSLYGTGLIAQITFLAIYRAFWLFIHRWN